MPELYQKGIDVFIDEFIEEEQQKNKNEKNKSDQKELTKDLAINL